MIKIEFTVKYSQQCVGSGWRPIREKNMSEGWVERRPSRRGALQKAAASTSNDSVIAGWWQGTGGFKRVGSVHVNHEPKNYL